MKKYVSKIENGDIAYFKFNENMGEEAFKFALVELVEWLGEGHIKNLVVNVSDMESAWGIEGQNIWKTTGQLCHENQIEKWGVVCPNNSKTLTIRHLIKRSGEPRCYDAKVFAHEEDVFSWVIAA